MLYADTAEIAIVVRKLEHCEYSTQEFKHGMHLAVAAWYLRQSSYEDALDRMRSTLQRFTQYHRVTAYHETITRFWLRLASDFMTNHPTNQNFAAQVNALIERYLNKNVLFEYYSRERVLSDAARNGWLEPDLRSL